MWFGSSPSCEKELPRRSRVFTDTPKLFFAPLSWPKPLSFEQVGHHRLHLARGRHVQEGRKRMTGNSTSYKPCHHVSESMCTGRLDQDSNMHRFSFGTKCLCLRISYIAKRQALASEFLMQHRNQRIGSPPHPSKSRLTVCKHGSMEAVTNIGGYSSNSHGVEVRSCNHWRHRWEATV